MDLDNTLHKLVCSQILFRELIKYKSYKGRDFVELDYVTQKVRDSPLIKDTLRKFYNDPLESKRKSNKEPNIDNEYVLNNLIAGVSLIYYKQLSHQDPNATNKTLVTVINQKLPAAPNSTANLGTVNTIIKFTSPIEQKLTFFKNLIYQLNNIVKKLLLYDIKSLEVKFKNYTNDIEIIESGRYTEEMLLKDDQEFKMSRRNKNQSNISQKQREKEKQPSKEKPQEKLPQEKLPQKNKLQTKSSAENLETPGLIDSIAVKNSMPFETAQKLNKESSPSDIKMINHPPVVAIDQVTANSEASTSISKDDADLKELSKVDSKAKEIISNDIINTEINESEAPLIQKISIPAENDHNALSENKFTDRIKNQEIEDSPKPSDEIMSGKLDSEAMNTSQIVDKSNEDIPITIDATISADLEENINGISPEVSSKVSGDSQKLSTSVVNNEQQSESTKNKSTKIPLIAYASIGNSESELPDESDQPQNVPAVSGNDNINSSEKVISDVSSMISEKLNPSSSIARDLTEDESRTVNQEKNSSSNLDVLNNIESKKDVIIKELNEKSEKSNSVEPSFRIGNASVGTVNSSDLDEPSKPKDKLGFENLNSDLSVDRVVNIVEEPTSLLSNSEHEPITIQNEKDEEIDTSHISQEKISKVSKDEIQSSDVAIDNKDGVDYLPEYSADAKTQDELEDEGLRSQNLETVRKVYKSEPESEKSEANISVLAGDIPAVSKEPNSLVLEPSKNNLEQESVNNNENNKHDKADSFEEVFMSEEKPASNISSENSAGKNSMMAETKIDMKPTSKSIQIESSDVGKGSGDSGPKKALSSNAESCSLEKQEVEFDDDEGHQKDTDVFKDAKENFEEKDEVLVTDRGSNYEENEAKTLNKKIANIDSEHHADVDVLSTVDDDGVVLLDTVEMQKDVSTPEPSNLNTDKSSTRDKVTQEHDILDSPNAEIKSKSGSKDVNKEEKDEEEHTDIIDVQLGEEQQEKKTTNAPIKRESISKVSSVDSSRNNSKNSTPKTGNSPHRNLRSSDGLFEPIELASELYSVRRLTRSAGKSESIHSDDAKQMQDSPSSLPAKRANNTSIESKSKGKKIRYSARIDDLQKQRDKNIDSKETSGSLNTVENTTSNSEEANHKSGIKQDQSQEEQEQELEKDEKKEEQNESIVKRINRRKSSRLEHNKDLTGEKLKDSDDHMKDHNISSDPTKTITSHDNNVKSKKRKFEKKNREDRSTVSDAEGSGASNKKSNIQESRSGNSVGEPNTAHEEDESEEVSHKKKRILEVNRKFIALANQIIDSISSLKFSSPFLNAVNENDAPSYYSVIYEPRDLKSIKNLVKIGEIANIKQLEREIMLMYANSVMYNRSNTDMNKWALEMEEESNKIMKMFSSSDFNDL